MKKNRFVTSQRLSDTFMTRTVLQISKYKHSICAISFLYERCSQLYHLASNPSSKRPSALSPWLHPTANCCPGIDAHILRHLRL